MEQKPESREIKSLTGIRGLAAIYVIVYHWHETLGTKPASYNATSAISTILVFIGHGYLSVDLFFVLSAFVLCVTSSKTFSKTISIDGYTNFMYKRFSRIFPLYIVVTLIYFFFAHEATLVNLLVNLTLFQGLSKQYNGSIIPPGWSLTNEWIIYFLVPLFLYLLSKLWGKLWIFPVVSISLFMLLALERAAGFNWYNFEQIKGVSGFYPIVNFTRGPASLLRTIASYFLGIFAYGVYCKSEKPRISIFFVVILAILLFIPDVDILIIVFLPILILYLTQDNQISKFVGSKGIHFLGLISYSLYVNHYLFIKIYNKKIAVHNHFGNYFSLLFILTGTIIFSTFTYYLIEKPGMKILRQFKGLKTIPTVK